MSQGRPPPEWLIGLGIAIVVVLVGVLIASMLGAGDDPTFADGLGWFLGDSLS
ncbi:MAG: hypothetical protein WD532_11815 [Acidimicrobiia bacterium]